MYVNVARSTGSLTASSGSELGWESEQSLDSEEEWFEMMPDISEMSLLGDQKSAAVGNDFEGTFYSLRYDRRGLKHHLAAP